MLIKIITIIILKIMITTYLDHWPFGWVHQNIEHAGLDGRKTHSSHSEKLDKKTITITDR